MLRKNLVHMLAVCCIGVIPLLGTLYVWIDRIGDRPVHTMITEIDRQIPFVKWFIIPYISWFPFLYLFLLYLCFKDRGRFLHTLSAYVAGVLICYVIFSFYQTTVPRPEITENDWLTYWVHFVYQHDQPYNCFPSIHAFSSYLLLTAAARSNRIKSRWLKVFVGFWACMIIASTVLIKQHSVLDVAAGIILAEAVYDILGAAFFKNKNKKIIPKIII